MLEKVTQAVQRIAADAQHVLQDSQVRLPLTQ